MDSIPSSRKRCSFRGFWKEMLYGFITEYETPKIVMIHSYSITTLLRILQILLLCYSVVYLLLYEKGYQKLDTSLISSITLKVKGIGYIHTEDNETFAFDGTDYIIPPSENNAIFIMTNFISTQQTRSACVESASVFSAICTKDSQCQNKPFNPNANGRWTGRCISSSERNTSNEIKTLTTNSTGLCEIQGWCPVENSEQNSTIIREILNFTIFIKNFIEFPLFDVKHKNMVDNLRSCVYDRIKSPDCPIFRLDYIMNEAEKNSTERELMLSLGGVIRAKIDWDCNLDRSIKLCKPKYSFARLDTAFSEETFSFGFNFRFASSWRYRRKDIRVLRKAFGLRLIISVSGRAGKFDFITLTLNTGSIVGIFGLATFFCDIILLNLSKKSSLYRDLVVQHVKPSNTDFRPNVQEHHENLATIVENPNVSDQKLLQSFRTTESLRRFSETADTVHSSPSQLFKLQPILGATNTLN